MIHITIDSVISSNPTLPPRASLKQHNGVLCVAVEDIGDPEVEAVCAAKAILEYFLSLHA